MWRCYVSFHFFFFPEIQCILISLRLNQQSVIYQCNCNHGVSRDHMRNSHIRDKSSFLCSVNSKLSELLSTTVAGKPAADDEEGGHPNEKQEALVEKQEEEGRRLLRPRWRHGRHDQGQRTPRSRQQTLPLRIRIADG